MAKKTNKDYTNYEELDKGEDRVQIGSLTPIRADFKQYTGDEPAGGRPKAFRTPQILWQTALDYQEWCENNPLWKSEWDYKTRTIVNLPVKRAMSMMGFCIYAGVNTTYLQQLSLKIQKNPNGLHHAEFANTIKLIRHCINQQKFEGAASGFFNATMISRALNLTEKIDMTSAGKEMKSLTGAPVGLTADDLAKLSDEELMVLRKLSGNLVSRISAKEETEEVTEDEIGLSDTENDF